MRVETAIKMIENHGLKAFVTPEGLACVCECVQSTPRKPAHQIAAIDDDCVFEEVTTFDIYNDGTGVERWNVRETLVRNWLGY